VRRATALATLTGLALAPRVAVAAESSLDDMLGRNILSIIDALGMPKTVVSENDGHNWSWDRAGSSPLVMITDDAMTVKAIVVLHPQTPGERLANVSLFRCTKARADAERGAPDFSGPNFRVYRLSEDRVLELLFDDGGNLTEAIYGARGHVARLGLVPADREMLRVLQYSAPKVGRTPLSAPVGPPVIVRCEIGKNGRVDAVSVVVSSHNASQDKLAVAYARKVPWFPAKFDNVPVKSVAFWMVQ